MSWDYRRGPRLTASINFVFKPVIFLTILKLKQELQTSLSYRADLSQTSKAAATSPSQRIRCAWLSRLLTLMLFLCAFCVHVCPWYTRRPEPPLILPLCVCACLCVCVYVLAAPGDQNSIRCPGLELQRAEPPCGCWEPTLGPLEEQPMVLTTEPSLQLRCQLATAELQLRKSALLSLKGSHVPRVLIFGSSVSWNLKFGLSLLLQNF